MRNALISLPSVQRRDTNVNVLSTCSISDELNAEKIEKSGKVGETLGE